LILCQVSLSHNAASAERSDCSLWGQIPESFLLTHKQILKPPSIYPSQSRVAMLTEHCKKMQVKQLCLPDSPFSFRLQVTLWDQHSTVVFNCHLVFTLDSNNLCCICYIVGVCCGVWRNRSHGLRHGTVNIWQHPFALHWHLHFTQRPKRLSILCSGTLIRILQFI
jgi:hypothetical protein